MLESTLGTFFEVLEDAFKHNLIIKIENEDKRRRALVPSVRNEIVHVLASSYPKVVKMLVKKYRFMRDIGDNVSGYVSILIY